MAELGSMPALEVAHWRHFEETFGPLTVHERIDALIQSHTGEKVQWRVVKPLTDDQLWGWLDAMARKPG